MGQVEEEDEEVQLVVHPEVTGSGLKAKSPVPTRIEFPAAKRLKMFNEDMT